MVKTSLLVLLTALRAIESSNGAASRNQLQIREVCVRDVNRIYGTSYSMKDAYDVRRSHEIAELYLEYWTGEYRKKTGLTAGYEQYARIWNGGPDGWKKRATLPYWRKVSRELVRMSAARTEGSLRVSRKR